MDQSFLVDHPLDAQYTSGNNPVVNNPLTHQTQNQNQNQMSNDQNSNYIESRLETPIPPLHVQQKFLNDTNKIINNVPESGQYLRSNCSRCKKDFDQPIIIPKANIKTENDENLTKPLIEPKIFKLCQHCRELQRQRSRRWQKKTKEKFGVCRRCGSDIPPELQKFVLCLNCRQNLRFRKANRAKQGRCVHCSGPLDTSILNSQNEDENQDNYNDDGGGGGGGGMGKSGQKNFKVCQRCRENDKIRRNNLEKLGNCNRCAKPLSNDDIGKHKVCINCRSKKKKSISNGSGIMQNENMQGHMQGNIPISSYAIDVSNTVPISSNGSLPTLSAGGVGITPGSASSGNGHSTNNHNGQTGQNGEFNDHLLHFNSYPIQQQLNQALQPSNPVQMNQLPNYNLSQVGQMPVVQNQLMGQQVGQVGQVGQMNQMNQMGQVPLHQIPLQHPIMVNQLGQLSQINNQMFHPMNQIVHHPQQQQQQQQGQTHQQNHQQTHQQTHQNGQGQKISPNQQNLPINNLQMNNISYQY